MNQRIKILFLIIVLLQGLHSCEEYIGKLWENFPPATFLCGLVSDNLMTGFIIINIALFVLGILAWLIPIQKEYSWGKVLIWFWILIELMNGIGHPIWTIMQKGYTPGVITAPFLLVTAITLLRELLNTNKG